MYLGLLCLVLVFVFASIRVKEMVSTGDTEISLHIRSPRFRAYRGGGWYSGVQTENTQSAKIYLNFIYFEGGVYFGAKSENTESAKICLNFNGGGVGALWSEISQRGSLENL